MTSPEEQSLAGLMDAFMERFVARLKDEGLYHDDRPPLTLEEAAARLNVSRRVIGDMIKPGPGGEPPALAVVKVIPTGHKGLMIEPREIDRFLEQQRRASWVAAAREGS